MKKISTKLVLLVAMVLTSMGVKAYDFKDGSLCYNILDASASAMTVEVTKLGDPLMGENNYAFTSVTIPSTANFNGKIYNVVKIGNSAFNNCTNLTSVTFPSPNTITAIESGAFYNCKNLPSIDIPSGVISIGEGAFSSCTKLSSVSLPDRLQFLGGFNGCTGLTSIVMPNTVTTLEGNAFSGCTGLTSVTFSNNLHDIRWAAFEGCTGLTSITLPYSVREIESRAFYGCTNLTSVTLGNVAYMSNEAFADCDKITSVTSYKRSNFDGAMSGIANNAFKGSVKATATLYVPEGCKTKYENTNWNMFSNIVEIPAANLPDYCLDFNGSGLAAFIVELDGKKLDYSDPVLFVPSGSSPTITINYSMSNIISMTVDGTNVSSNLVSIGSDNYTYTFNNVDKDLNVVLHETMPIQFNVNYDSALGSVYDGTTLLSPVKSYNFAEGSTITLTITPHAGYEIQSVMTSIGTDVTSSLVSTGTGSYTYTIGSLDYSNQSLTINFGAPSTTSSVWANFNPDRGTISDDKGNTFIPGNTVAYTKGDNVTLTFTPNPGYRLVDVYLNGMSILASLTNGSYTISKISANVNLDVIYEPMDITLTIKDAMNGVSRLSVKGGSQMTIAFQASTGWAIGKVMFEDGTGATPIDVTASLTPDGEYTTPALIGNATITVTYKNTDSKYLIGDVNGDGKVDIVDVTTVIDLILRTK